MLPILDLRLFHRECCGLSGLRELWMLGEFYSILKPRLVYYLLSLNSTFHLLAQPRCYFSAYIYHTESFPSTYPSSSRWSTLFGRTSCCCTFVSPLSFTRRKMQTTRWRSADSWYFSSLSFVYLYWGSLSSCRYPHFCIVSVDLFHSIFNVRIQRGAEAGPTRGDAAVRSTMPIRVYLSLLHAPIIARKREAITLSLFFTRQGGRCFWSFFSHTPPYAFCVCLAQCDQTCSSYFMMYFIP